MTGGTPAQERTSLVTAGTAEAPWVLRTPPLSSEYTAHYATANGTDVVVVTVGKTVLHYDRRCVDDLHTMLQGARRLDGARVRR
jgi:hypothetical protein